MNAGLAFDLMIDKLRAASTPMSKFSVAIEKIAKRLQSESDSIKRAVSANAEALGFKSSV